MRRVLYAVFAVLVLALLYAGYAFLSLRELEAGVKAGNAEAISSHVDFPAVRESLKEQLATVVMARALDEKRSPGARLGAGLLAAIGPALIDVAVDRFVSPAAVGALLSRRAPGAAGGENGVQKELDLGRFADRFELISPTRFRITHKDGVAIVFALSDWTWKVADIRIPSDVLKKSLRPEAGGGL